MTGTDQMRKFAYRQPRVDAGLNVEFVTNGQVFSGMCRDVNDAGLRADLAGPVAVGSSGLLILRHPEGVIKLNARVAYVEDCHVGLVFHFDTPWERRLTVEFIASITHDPGTALVPLLP